MRSVESGACADHDTVIGEYRVTEDPDTADPKESAILTLDQSTCTHKGGGLVFGPDGYLYAVFGDGGDWWDNLDQAQDVTTLNGSIIRIDVDSGDPYAVPKDNPLVGTDARAEIVAWGSGTRG